MNIYNSYIPFNTAFPMNQIPVYQNPLQLLQLDSLITAHYRNLAQLSAQSLNQKRQLLSQPFIDFDERNTLIGASQKKFKTEQGAYNLKFIENDHYMMKNLSQKMNTKPQVISLEEDEDCLKVNNSGLQMPPNDFSKFQAYKEQLATQRKLNDFGAELKVVKPSEVIIIDNEDETDQQQSTCQTTPLIETEIQIPAKVDVLSNFEGIFALQTNLKPIEPKIQENSLNKNCYAKIPSFQLSAIPSQKRKARSVKSVWTPAAFEPEAFQKWSKQIEETVGIQITSEVKILNTMKSFNMNIEVALAEIKRNKAYYRSYFRVQKFQRN